MAKIEDLIAQIPDGRLKKAIGAEVRELKKKKKFGLVFEEHLPETVRLPNLPVKEGGLVARRHATENELWRVKSIREGTATLEKAVEGYPLPVETVIEVPVAELVVVLRFGDAIYPALVPVDRLMRGGPDKPWHTLINADNFHALQLLLYAYEGKVDAIYIDPPFNTGARDWKYNNDYVDKNDPWRHSKWLSMMQRRLKLAKQLLNPEDSVLIVAIDEKEYLRLGMLLEQVFIGCNIQMVSTLINPASVARAGSFGRNDEYIFFVMIGAATPQRVRLDREWVSAKGRTHTGNLRWDLLRRSGPGASRKDSPGCFYPIYVNPQGPVVAKIGDAVPIGQSAPKPPQGCVTILPIRKNGSEGRWQWTPATIRQRLTQGRVRITGTEAGGFVVSILKDGEYAKVRLRKEKKMIGAHGDSNCGRHECARDLRIAAVDKLLNELVAVKQSKCLFVDYVITSHNSLPPSPACVFHRRSVFTCFGLMTCIKGRNRWLMMTRLQTCLGGSSRTRILERCIGCS